MGMIEQQAKALLIRGKARFTGPDRLVKNWEDLYEDVDGAWSNSINIEQAFQATGEEPCRMCIMGSYGLEEGLVDRKVYELVDDTISAILHDTGDSVYRPHTLQEVLAIYDKAIASIGDE